MAATDIVILQRDGSNENQPITVTGSGNLNAPLGFDGSGVFGALSEITVTTAGVTTANVTTLRILDNVDQSHGLSFVVASDLTDNRTLTLTTGDANRALTIQGDVTLPAGTALVSGGSLGTPSSGTGTNLTGIPEAGLTLADNTTNDASTTKHGFLKKLSNVATEYMDGTGNWSEPPGGGGSVATDTIWNAAGDLAQGTGSDTAARLGIGTAGQVLTVNAGATAAEWAAPSGGGAFVPLLHNTSFTKNKLFGVAVPHSSSQWQNAGGYPVVSSSGSASEAAISATKPRGLTYTVSATTGPGGVIGNNVYIFNDWTDWVYTVVFEMGGTINVANWWIGLHPSSPDLVNTQANAISFRYSRGTGGAGDSNFQCYSNDNGGSGGEVITDTGVTPATSTLYTVVIKKSGTSVLFYLNGTLEATHTFDGAGAAVMPACRFRNNDSATTTITVYGTTMEYALP